METKFPYVHRDISWLSFNYRVLQEAKDPSVPLMERIKFLAIYSSNLDEFFRVRVANIRHLVRVGKKTRKQLDFDPVSLLDQLHDILNRQQEEFSDIFENQILNELRENNIYLLKRKDLSQEQVEFVENFFQDKLLPFVQPVVLIKNKIRPFLNNAALYLALDLKSKDEDSDSGELDRYAVVKIPSDHLDRFILLPSSDPKIKEIILLDDVVRHSALWLFPGYTIENTYSLKLTRDAELYIDDEFSGDLIKKIKKSLLKRHVGPASRFVYDRTMPKSLLAYLINTFELEDFDLLPEGRYHNNFDFFQFPDFNLQHLKNTPMPPIPYPPLENAKNIFTAIRQRDHLIHVPYHSYESVIRYFEDAAKDPNVTHIKVIQYRVAKKSRIMKALMDAVKVGKLVTVFIEVKARFDEEANLAWGERLEQAGVKVHYSLPGVKVHSKLAIVIRTEREKNKIYAYMSTGNFHEDTAKIYSDFGFFTVDPRITLEANRVFTFLETIKVPQEDFKHLLVGQFNLRKDLNKCINQEIKNAKAGKPAAIILKMNSLQDQKMIEKLYEASGAGVNIQLIIRGLCSLVPGIKGFSENIRVISIVDRFLEHARIFIFHNNGREKIYLSSADWMVRNLSYRIETIFPIYNPACRKIIKDFIDIQLRDNVKSRIIDEAMSNKYVTGDPNLMVRSQLETYFYIKRMDQVEWLQSLS